MWEHPRSYIELAIFIVLVAVLKIWRRSKKRKNERSPQEVMRRQINHILAGAYNDYGVRLWWKRKRPQLDDKTPEEVFATDPERVMRLAEGLLSGMANDC
jgi:hypothetical protein